MYEFFETDPERIRAELTGVWQTVSGAVRPPATGSDADLLIAFLAWVLSLQRQEENKAVSKNFIEYAEGADLDRIGMQMTGRARGTARKAKTTLRFSLDAAAGTDTPIPAGTRATADDVIFFATTADAAIPAGETSADVPAECTLAGEMANRIPIGAIDRITDTLPGISAVENTTVTHSGADEETDAEYREALWAAYGGITTAGSEAGYLYYAQEASADVTEAAVDTDGAGTVNIYVVPPEASLADEVQAYFDGLDVVPMTDKVEVSAAQTLGMHAQIVYSVAKEDRSREAQIDADVAEAARNYLQWQCGHLGRGINADRLKQYVYNAGADRVSIYRYFVLPAGASNPVAIVSDDNKNSAYATYETLGKNVTVGVIADTDGVTVNKAT